MGIKKFLDKLQQNAEIKQEQANDPAFQKQQQREAAQRNVQRTMKAFELAKKGLKTYGDVSKKIDEVRADISQKTVEFADKAKPVADQIDNTVASLGEKAKEAFTSAKKTVTDKAQKLAGETTPKKKDGPSTGSSVLDFLSPAVPKTDATTPKQPKP